MSTVLQAHADHFDLISRRMGFIPLPLGLLVSICGWCRPGYVVSLWYLPIYKKFPKSIAFHLPSTGASLDLWLAVKMTVKCFEQVKNARHCK